jgi:hypothetical protein
VLVSAHSRMRCISPVCALAAVLLMSLLFTSCGGGMTPQTWNGTAGNVLLQEVNGNSTPAAEIWVGFDSSDNITQLKSITGTADDQIFASGRVVLCSDCTWGFYLDPTTTALPGIAIPEDLKSIQTIKDNLPAWSGRKVVIWAKVLKVQEL